MKKTGINKNVIMLCECAVMVALATVLSLIKIEFPYGGSITICSMLPIDFNYRLSLQAVGRLSDRCCLRTYSDAFRYVKLCVCNFLPGSSYDSLFRLPYCLWRNRSGRSFQRY